MRLMSKKYKDDIDLMKATTGILDNLFKHSENTCTKAIKYGGLDSTLNSCGIYHDTTMLRNCAEALANSVMYGGADPHPRPTYFLETPAPGIVLCTDASSFSIDRTTKFIEFYYSIRQKLSRGGALS